MSNPFGAEPPVKPAKTAKPAPANPFGASNPRPAGSAGAGVAKPPKRNPFDPAQPAFASNNSSTIPIAPLGGAPSFRAPAPKAPEIFMAPPPLPPPLPSQPIPDEIAVEIISTPTAPPPPPPSIPSDFPVEEEFMPVPMPPPVPPVDDFLVVETPKHAPPPVAVRATADDFDFAPSGQVSSDPFGMPAAAPVSNDFGFSVPAAADFDAFDSNKAVPPVQPEFSVQPAPVAVVEEEEIMSSLPPPPPQLDDDPFDLHVTKPPPVQPVIQPAPVTTARRNAPSVSVAKPAAVGDPFLDLLPGSVIKARQPLPHDATAAHVVKDLKDSLPLSALMQQQQQQKYEQQVVKQQQQQQQQSKPIVANPFAPQPVAVTAAPPVKPQHHAQHQQPQQQSAVVSHTAPIIAGDDDDFGVFGQSSAPPKKQPPADPFASSTNAISFTSSIVPADDFDVFGSSSQQPAPVSKVTPAKTVPFAAAHAAAPVDDFDIFASKSHTKAPAPPVAATGFDDDGFGNAFASPSPAAPVVEEDDTFDVFGLPNPKKPSVAAANSIFSPNAARASGGGGFDDEDPFAAPSSNNNNLGAFSTDTDPLAALKAGYGLQSTAASGDDRFYDGFDDDFDFDNATHGSAGEKKYNQHPGNVTSSAGSTLHNGLPAGAPGDDRVLDGDILSRLSTKAMFTKDWHDTYFVIKQGVLFLYRSRVDYQYNPNGTNYKKRFPITYNMRLLQIKGKEYKGLGTVYNFVLEELLDYGPATLGKFGATDKELVQQLWKYIRDLIMFKRRDRQRGKPVYGK